MAKLPDMQNITLTEVDKALEDKQQLEAPRNYLGMSQIGDECWRKLFYSFRGAEKRMIQASGLRAIEDGFLQEDVMSERLRMLPFIQLHTTAPDSDKQIGFSLLLDHFRGHCDGMILGIKEAPKTWHVWEHKSVNETKFKKLNKLKEEKGEKKALAEWDEIYFSQAQIYMHQARVERHYLTVTTPGGRDYTSCRTEFNNKIAENLITKGKSIIFDNWNIPPRASSKREFYKCKWCEYSEICHDTKFPLVNCKTCRYSEPINEGKRKCLLKDTVLENNSLWIDTCPDHVYNPALVPAELVEHQSDCCIYKSESGFVFANCSVSGIPETKGIIDDIYTSQHLRDKIVFANNLKKDAALEIQKSFDGSFKEPKKWDTGVIVDP